MEIDLVGESIKFMILGMTVVFVFLMILVQFMKLQAYIIGKYFPDTVATSPSASPKGPSEDEKARVAAIIAAVTEFRKSKSSSKG